MEKDNTCAVEYCGHPRSAHYTYILNGAAQMRCRLCDPHRNRRGGGEYEMVSGSAEADMYLLADHDFKEG